MNFHLKRQHGNPREEKMGSEKVLIQDKVGDSPIYKMSVAEEIRGRQFR